MNKLKKGFTLVELIVVITIITILGSIAFISLQGYGKRARDSTRLSDLSTMKTSLEIFHLNSGKYPITTDAFTITYSGSEVWSQGTFGETTVSNVDKLDKIPTDPLTGKEYTYSVTKTKQQYELSGIMEDYEFSSTTFSSDVLAGDNIITAIVTGNYNGTILKTATGVNCEILAVPSIISSQTRTTTNLIDILNNYGLVYHGYNNLPSEYISSKYNANGGFDYISNKLVVYSDTLECKPLYDVNNDTARIEFITNLQTAYSGTIIQNVDSIKEYVNIDLTDSSAINLLSVLVVNNELNGSLEIPILTSGGGGGSGTEPVVCSFTQEELDTLNAYFSSGTIRAAYDMVSWGSITGTTEDEWCNNVGYLEWWGGEPIDPLLWKLTNLNGLGLYNAGITNLPLGIGNLTNLTVLRLNNNSLTSLPSEIANLTNLIELDLSSNVGLGVLSEIFYANSNNLVQDNITPEGYPLSISGNGTNIDITVITNLVNGECGFDNGIDLYFTPTNLCNIGVATPVVDNGEGFTFNWSCDGFLGGTASTCSANHIISTLTQTEADELNALTGFNYTIEQRLPVTSLDLYNKGLTSIPTGTFDLIYLTNFILSSNQITTLPIEIGNLVYLTIFRLSSNQITTLPIEIGNLINLDVLEITGNNLTALPIEIGNLTKLTELLLSSNQITTLPIEIGNLINLYYINLGSNLLTEIPSQIGNLTKLTLLNLQYNQLSTLPVEIGNLINVIMLRINDNQLSTLPVEIGNLINLQTLDINNNELLTLPSNIENLANLGNLYIENNLLNILPSEISNLTNTSNLSRIYLSGNLSLGNLNYNFINTSAILSQSNITPEGYTMDISGNGTNIVISTY